MSSSLLLMVIALLLVLLNGFFVAAEFALVKLRQTRVAALADQHGWRGKILVKVHSHLDAYLSACQLGITLASLGLGWIGEPAFATLLEPLFGLIGVAGKEAQHGIAFIVAFFVISYLHIVVGELAPKSVAIRSPEPVSAWTAAPLYIFYWTMFPLIWMLNQSANWLLRKAGMDTHHSHDTHYSTAELKQILRASHPSSGFAHEELRNLAQALDFRELQVTDLMRPFREAITLCDTDSPEQQRARIMQHRYSRYPYLDQNGSVLGVVHVKDMYFAMSDGGAESSSIAHLLRPVLTVPPHLSAIALLRRFQQGAPHFAIIQFPGQAPLGFITLDNLLGELVGQIRDEFRPDELEWVKLSNGALTGKASLPIVTLERALGIDIEESGVESVGGLIVRKLGEIPSEGQRVNFDQFDILIRKMDGPKIVQVEIYPAQNHESC